jgi:hypothetical protein
LLKTYFRELIDNQLVSNDFILFYIHDNKDYSKFQRILETVGNGKVDLFIDLEISMSGPFSIPSLGRDENSCSKCFDLISMRGTMKVTAW